MPPVAVRILHTRSDPAAGPLGRWVSDARGALAERHLHAFERAGADDVAIVSDPADDRSFGARLRTLVAALTAGGLVVLGSGSIPLATIADRRRFIGAAASQDARALANNQHSADVVGISCVERLPTIPALTGDNELPRWLREVAGYPVDDLRRRWRLGVDIDGPLDLILTDTPGPSSVGMTTLRGRLAAVQQVLGDSRAELLVAGRSSSTTLAWLERHTASRTRALIEERGLRAAGLAAQRPPASVLGALLELDGPASLGVHLARLGDAAIIDTRVLLAHRLGADEASWPAAEDRFASDLLLVDRIADPWLRDLTASAVAAPIPVLLGGHTLVGPGLRLIIGGTWT